MNRTMRRVTGFLLLIGPVLAASQPVQTPGVLAIRQLKEASPGSLQLTSGSFTPGGPIPITHSDYGEKVSPALQWSGVPPTTKSLAIVMEDPDARDPKPFVHWLVYNLPPSVAALPEGLSSVPKLKQYEGALQGRTSRGNIGYFGPRPPKTDSPHHYYLQVFALDAMLPLDPGATRDALLRAMDGHVVAAGQIMGTFKAPPEAK
jgi:Raf kinase inhibitor-like YbhB/YbcL family protein